MKFRMGVFLFCVVLLWGTETQAQADETAEYFSEVYDSPEQIPKPETEYTDSAGKQYELRSRTVEEVIVTGREKTVDGEIVYTGVGADMAIPETADLEVTDEESGQRFYRTLPLCDRKFSGERWEEGFTFTATFHTYDADIYQLGDLEIPGGGDEPSLGGCEAELLSLIGRDGENYRIENYRWDKDAYMDESGVLCRDAEVSGRRRVSDCRALYRGTVSLPDLVRYRERRLYAQKAEETAAQTAASPAQIPEPPARPEAGGRWEKLFEIIKTCFTVSLWLTGILAAAFGLWFLIRFAKKLDKNKKNRNG